MAIDGCENKSPRNSEVLFLFLNSMVETAGSIRVRVRINCGFVEHSRLQQTHHRNGRPDEPVRLQVPLSSRQGPPSCSRRYSSHNSSRCDSAEQGVYCKQLHDTWSRRVPFGRSMHDSRLVFHERKLQVRLLQLPCTRASLGQHSHSEATIPSAILSAIRE